jgi:hypothetical protein
VIDGVFAVGEGEQVQFCEAGAPTPEDLAAVQQQARARVRHWFRPPQGTTSLYSSFQMAAF